MLTRHFYWTNLSEGFYIDSYPIFYGIYLLTNDSTCNPSTWDYPTILYKYQDGLILAKYNL